MSDPSAAPPTESPPDLRHEPVARPWELELLISGGVTFALLQAPEVVDRVFITSGVHLAGTSRFALFIGYYTTKLILYILIASFVLHLAARAYWVGLIALDTVFPQGIKWDKTTFGPNFAAVYRERLPRLPVLIARADAFCSVIFPFAFAVVFLFAMSIVLAALVGAVAWVVSALAFGGRYLGPTFAVLFLVVLVPQSIATLVDKSLGKRLAPDGRAARTLRAVARLFYRLQLTAIHGTIVSVLFTNVRKRAIYPAYFAVLFAPVVLFLVKDILVRNGALPMDAYVFVPDRSDVSPSFYESQRESGAVYGMTPSIQSDIIRDPYVKLFIPYLPERHNETLSVRCPELRPLQRAGFRFELPSGAPPDTNAVRLVLDCWTRLQPVTLNGQPHAPPFYVYTHPRSGARGIIAYIPTAGLPRGPNVLTIGRLPRVGMAARVTRGRPNVPYVIRFWL